MHIVIGHKNPDTDSAVSAFIYAQLKCRLKEKSAAFLAGRANKETIFVFKHFKAKLPTIMTSLANQKVILVDHNNALESSGDIDKAEIHEVIEHHFMSGLTTEKPIFYRSEKVGSTCTIIAKIFKDHEINPNKQQAGMLLCGIISDTLKFTSPTTSPSDKKIAKELAKISGVNISTIAKEMFRAKSDISDMKPIDIITSDFKKFSNPAGNVSFGIGVCETTDPKQILSQKDILMKELADKKSKENLDLAFFAPIDIIKQKAYMFLISEKEKDVAEKAFKTKAQGSIIILDKVVSRKTQILPPILSAVAQ